MNKYCDEQSLGYCDRGHQRERCHGQRFDFDFMSSPSSRDPMLRASDSSTVRNSGSPISRRLSPNSIGIGLSEGGAFCASLPGGGLTSPCRSLIRATARYPKNRFTRSIISGMTCWTSGACAGLTTRCMMPSDFSPGGKRIISGVHVRACISPTISGQRLTTELWTKPNRRKALRPICGIKSLIGLASPPRGREYWRPRAPLSSSVLPSACCGGVISGFHGETL